MGYTSEERPYDVTMLQTTIYFEYNKSQKTLLHSNKTPNISQVFTSFDGNPLNLYYTEFH